MRQQRTLATEVTIQGTAIHQGGDTVIRLKPSESDSGIVFVTQDGKTIPALWNYVTQTNYQTTLSQANHSISLVEHLMAALAGCGIDNVSIECDGTEIPIMDGSALPFVKQIREAGIVSLDEACRHIKVDKEISVSDGDSTISLSPCDDGFIVDYVIDFSHPLIGRQQFSYRHDDDAFVDNIAPARTFGMYEEWDYLKSQGLANGASFENSIVLNKDSVMNSNGLRFDDEFVRHKVLDCVGDLHLGGAPMVARVQVHKGGHGLHRAALAALFADDSAWSWQS